MRARRPSPSSSASAAPTHAARPALAAIVLAAGKGTRMRSARAKVLHPVLGLPLVCHAVDRARALGARPIVAVLGHQRPAVEQVLRDRYGDAVTVREQTEQRGTGHAARVGLSALPGHAGTVLILYGDTPLLTDATLRALVRASRRGGRLAILTARLPDPTGYGRILRDRAGRVTGVIEHRDAGPEERAIDEINAGMYAVPADFLRRATRRLSPRNAQRELYLTDIVAAAVRGIGAVTVEAPAEEILGVNDRSELVRAEHVLRARINRRWAETATLRAPDRITIEPDVVLGTDVELAAGVELRGRTQLGDGVRVGPGVILTDVRVEAGAEIKAYTVAEDARVGARCKVGPFAHLRPGTVLGDDVHVGNFVETKKARLGRGSKANHLSYLGDAEVGARVNVGAGTITCNYNGYEKRVTVIEDGAFIGSDSQLVAPVRVGRQAVVAAGATVTRDVPARALAIGRAPEQHVAGYAERLAARYGKTLDEKIG